MRRLTIESTDRSTRLLSRADAPPFVVEKEGASSSLVLICDHAGRAIPAGLKLGVPPSEMDRHIAWDIGVAELGRQLADRLDACLVRQPYSRLVIDCNRHPHRADAMPEISDATPIPANKGLDAGARALRIAEIHAPYHQRIAGLLDARAETGLPTTLLLLHSFTPRLDGFDRPWRFGVLHTGEPFARALLSRLREADCGEVGDNAPYAMDETDYTAERHGRRRGLDYAELEVRQDLIADATGQAAVTDLLAAVLPLALAEAAQR